MQQNLTSIIFSHLKMAVQHAEQGPLIWWTRPTTGVGLHFRWCLTTFYSHSADTLYSHSADTFYSHSADTFYSHSPDTFYSHSPDTFCSHSADTFYSHSADIFYSHSPDTFYSHLADTFYSHSPDQSHLLLRFLWCLLLPWATILHWYNENYTGQN